MRVITALIGRSHALGRDGLPALSLAGAPALSPVPVLARPPVQCAVPVPTRQHPVPFHGPAAPLMRPATAWRGRVLLLGRHALRQAPARTVPSPDGP